MREAWSNRKSSSRTGETSSSESSRAMLMPVAAPAENFSISIIRYNVFKYEHLLKAPDLYFFILFSLEGNVADIAVKPHFTIQKVKTIVMKHFYGNDTSKIPSQYRLIHFLKFKQLVDDCSVTDEEIKEHGSILI